MNYAELEPLVPDQRLDGIRDTLLGEYPLLDRDSVFVTYIQPRIVRELNEKPVELPEVACFAVISKNPKGGADVMTVGSAWLDVFRREDSQRSHFVGVKDMLLVLYRPVVKRHIETLSNLRDMGHSEAQSIQV